MEYLTQYINIYYMLTFMAVSYFTLKHISLPKQINNAWWVLIIGALIGCIFHLVDEGATVKRLLTTYALGTSFYELVIAWVLKKLNL